jgi:hypothetical protein
MWEFVQYFILCSGARCSWILSMKLHVHLLGSGFFEVATTKSDPGRKVTQERGLCLSSSKSVFHYSLLP